MAAGGDKALLAQLRAQVDAMTTDRITPTMIDSAHRTTAAAIGAGETVRDRAQSVAGQLRQRPLATIAGAVAIGWVLARLRR